MAGVSKRGKKWVARLAIGDADFNVGVCGSEEAARACLARHHAAVADGTSPFLLEGARTLKSFAGELGVRHGTVRRWATEGMPVIRAEHVTLVVRDQAIAWVKAHRKGSVAFARKAVVYFAERESDRAIKVGWSSDIRRRLLELAKRERCEVSLIAAIPGDKPDELALQSRFARDSVGNEWFRPSADIQAFIASLGRTAA